MSNIEPQVRPSEPDPRYEPARPRSNSTAWFIGGLVAVVAIAAVAVMVIDNNRTAVDTLSAQTAAAHQLGSVEATAAAAQVNAMNAQQQATAAAVSATDAANRANQSPARAPVAEPASPSADSSANGTPQQ
jgi:hypothetical protein